MDTAASTMVVKMVAAWADAETRGDVDALGTILADDFVGVGPRGFLLPREAWLERHRSGALRYEALAWDDLTVRTYGETLVVIGRQDARGSYQGHDTGGQLRGTLIWTRQGDRWRLAGLQYSPLAGSP
jgi:ketosteroid isomerase-like protein